MCLFQYWFPQGICLGVGLLGHMVVLFLVFKEPPYHLPQWLYQSTFPPTVQEHSLFSTTAPAFTVYRLFVDGHFDWYEVISHCIDLHFSNNERCRASFHVFASHLYVFFGEMSVQVFFPLFDWVVCFSGTELYQLLVYFGNYPLSVVSFAIIFSHSEGCLFTLLVSFAVKKLLSLIRSHLFIFISITLVSGSQRILL